MTLEHTRAVEDALREVIDPEIGLDFVELGLIYNIQVEEGIATITYSLTSPGCPIGPAIEEQLIQAARTVSGIEQVSATLTFNPSWTPDDMSEDAKFALGY